MSTETPVTSREQLLARMDAAWTAFVGPALALGARMLGERTPVGWTYAQMLAHVRAWHELTARRLREYAATGSVDLPSPETSRQVFADLGLAPERAEGLLGEWSTDGFNAAVAEAAASEPLHGFMPSVYASYRKVREAVAALSDQQVGAQVADGRPFVEALVDGNTYGHYAEHQSELDRVIPRTGADLVARIDAEWRQVRDAVRRQGRTGLAQPTLEGWTYKDLLAHLVGWLEDIPRRIEAIRAGTDKPISGQSEIDEYNARSVSSHALVGPEAMLDELDTSYRRMRSAVAGLTAEEVANARILGLVATRTYLHWQEHERELEGKR